MRKECRVQRMQREGAGGLEVSVRQGQPASGGGRDTQGRGQGQPGERGRDSLEKDRAFN